MRERRYLIWIALGTFFLVVFNLPSSVQTALRGFFRDSIASYQGAISGALSGLHRTSAAVGGLGDVVKERDRLEKEVAVLRASLKAMERLAQENRELSRLLEFRRRLGHRTVACRVIARDDGYGWWQTLRLGKGAEDGIREHMPVMTSEGLVGRTIGVSARTSDVLLISDRNFKVSVRFPREGSYGILQGGGVSLRGEHKVGVFCSPHPFQVSYVRKDLAIKPGDTVTTSGLGGVFPPGLAVGLVTGVAPDETGLFQVAQVAPAADLDRIREVLVVVGE